MWWKIILFVILGLTVIIAAVLAYGSRRWQSATKTMYAKLEAARLSIEPTTVEHTGTFNMSETGEQTMEAVHFDPASDNQATGICLGWQNQNDAWSNGLCT